jgi:hypothetical protein
VPTQYYANTPSTIAGEHPCALRLLIGSGGSRFYHMGKRRPGSNDLHALSTTGIAFEAACTFASASLRYSFGRGNVANKLQAVDLKTSRAWPQRASRYILVYTYCKLIKSCSFRMALEPNCVNGVYLHLFGHEDFAARRRKATCTCLDPCAAYFIALLEDEALNYAILRRDGPRRVKQANRLYRANSSWTR